MSIITSNNNQLMASLHVSRSTLCPVSVSQFYHSGKSYSTISESDVRKSVLRLRSCRNANYSTCRGFRVWCAAQDGDNQGSSEEPPESLFMKELKRRGMSPNSLFEDAKRSSLEVDDEVNVGEEDKGFPKRNMVSPEYDKSLSNQRERSMALNSEGLEGLVPRAKVLLTIGGTFFLGFWPLIVLTVSIFSALSLFPANILKGWRYNESYLWLTLALVFVEQYFGPTFVHDGSNIPISPPQYINPYSLLEDDRISQIVPRVK